MSGKIIVLCSLASFLVSNCTFYHHTPPNTVKECVTKIYQSDFSGGSPTYESFNNSLHSSYDSTPGITYGGGTMRACADGTVSTIITLDTGRHGGEMVTVGHGYNIYTLYAHLDRLYVESGQQVRRGDPIGNPDFASIPKLMLKVHDNWENPDNWGPNHGLMVNRKDLLKRESYSTSVMRQMLDTQFSIIQKFYASIDVQIVEWYQRIHNPSRRGTAKARWSLVEHMRYLECLYNREPERFKGINLEEFNKKKEEFYKNQPVVLTLPF